MMDVGQTANGRKILGSSTKNGLELRLRLIELSDFEQRAPERDTSGKIGRMPRKARATGFNGVVKTSCPAVFVGERGEGNRRRVLLDPALQLLDSRRVRHADNSTIRAPRLWTP